MSNEEKALQVVETIEELEAAKVTLALLQEKIEKVSEVYRVAGEALYPLQDRDHQAQVVGGKLHFGARGSSKLDPSMLLNETEAIALIIERDTARQNCENARVKLASMGITCIA